jgi:hypothetical protein
MHHATHARGTIAKTNRPAHIFGSGGWNASVRRTLSRQSNHMKNEQTATMPSGIPKTKSRLTPSFYRLDFSTRGQFGGNGACDAGRGLNFLGNLTGLSGLTTFRYLTKYLGGP